MNDYSGSSSKIPEPADPLHRHTRLPSQTIKSSKDDPEDRELFWYAESAQEVWDPISSWYRRADSVLIGDGETVD